MKGSAKYITLILIGFLFNLIISAQDTLSLDLKKEYYKESDTIGILQHYVKNIYYKADYSRELIHFTKDSAKLEYCFYYDKERYCLKNRTYYFSLSEDSIISVTYNGYNEKWQYKSLTDSLYSLSRLTNNIIETGYAKNLMPLEKFGDFFLIDLNNDTLCKINYTEIIFPKLTLKDAPTIDSIYVICDSMPIYPGGLDKMRQDLIKNIKYDMPITESYPICGTIFFSFVIDKQGKMKDVEIIRSCDNGFVEKAVLIALNNLDTFKNGFMNNKPVNVRFTLPLHILFQ